MKFSFRTFLSGFTLMVKKIPVITLKYYTWVFVGVLCVFIGIGSAIFYLRAYSITTNEPQGTLRRVIISEERLKEVEDRIQERQERFASPPPDSTSDPF